MVHNKPSPEAINAALELVKAIYEAIKVTGSTGVPSGILYAQLMGSMNLQTYQSMISHMERAGMIEQRNHVLTAIV